MQTNQLIITAGTSPAELQRFAESIPESSSLYGQRTNLGTVVYVKNLPTNLRDWLNELWHRVSGRAAKERQVAKDTIIQIVRESELDATFRCDGRSMPVLGALQDGLMTSVRSRSMRGRDLNLVAKVLSTTDRLAPRGPRMGDVPNSTALLFATAEILLPLSRARSAAERDVLAHKLAFVWAKKLEPFLETAEGRAWGARLALSSGAAFIHEMRWRSRQDVVPVNEHHYYEVLSKALAYLVPGIVPAEEIENGSIVVNNKLYVREKRLGTEGGMTLVRYQNKADPADRIIVKRQPLRGSVGEDATAKLMLMRDAHRLFEATTVKDAFIRRPLGAVRMHDGSLGLVLKDSGSARIRDVVSAVMASDQSETVKTSVRFRILTDVAQSLLALKTQKDLVNLHFTVDNLRVGTDGRTRIGDFGLTERADYLDLAASELVNGRSLKLLPGQHPSHFPPEFHRTTSLLEPNAVMQLLERQSKSDETALRKSFRAASQGDRDLLANCLQDSNKSTLVRKVVREAAKGSQETSDFTAMQSWMFGCLVFELFYGRPIIQSSDLITVRRKLSLIAERGEPLTIHPTRDEATETTFGGRSRVPYLDRLLKGLLHPNPQKRMTIEQALQHEAFSMLPIDRAHEQLANVVFELEQPKQPVSSVDKRDDRSTTSSDTSGYESAEAKPKSRIKKIGRAIGSKLAVGLETLGKAGTFAAR